MDVLTQICNRALMLIGTSTITNIDSDTNKEAKACRLLYRPVKEGLLAAYPWSFAKRIERLVPINRRSEPELHSNYRFVYQLPADFLKVVHVNCVDDVYNPHMPFPEYEIMVDKLHCNLPFLRLEYVANMHDVTKMPPYFIEAFVYKLALELTTYLTNDPRQIDRFYPMSEQKLQQARQLDSDKVGATSMYTRSRLTEIIGGEWL